MIRVSYKTKLFIWAGFPILVGCQSANIVIKSLRDNSLRYM